MRTCKDVRAHGTFYDVDDGELCDRLADFSVELGEALDLNVGLDHSKVREYWLTRGPRLFLTAVAFFVFCIVCQETLKGKLLAEKDRVYTIAVNCVALLVASFMLYYRLADSIEGVVARSAHDFYVSCKTRNLNPCAQSVNRRAVQAPPTRTCISDATSVQLASRQIFLSMMTSPFQSTQLSPRQTAHAATATYHDEHQNVADDLEQVPTAVPNYPTAHESTAHESTAHESSARRMSDASLSEWRYGECADASQESAQGRQVGGYWYSPVS